MKNIAVLITCHNRKTTTLSCLDALYDCSLPEGYSFKVFLVDDGSTDGTSTAIKERFSNVNIIQGSGSLYWNRGMCLAWRTAKSYEDFDYYLWLNDDTKLIQDGLIELLQAESFKEDNVLVCGATKSAYSGNFTYGGRSLLGEEIKPNGNIQNCAQINGNVVLVNKKMCNSIGMLDPVFPHAIGDFEYGLRAVKKGYKVITSKKFVGICERNLHLPKWCYSETPLLTRIKSLYSPLGNCHPYYFFIYEFRYYGLLTAIKHFLSIHLRVMIPSLWKQE